MKQKYYIIIINFSNKAIYIYHFGKISYGFVAKMEMKE